MTCNVQPKWSYVLFVDDEDTICSLVDRKGIRNLEDYGQVLKSGWGSVIEWIDKNYEVDYNYTSQ